MALVSQSKAFFILSTFQNERQWTPPPRLCWNALLLTAFQMHLVVFMNDLIILYWQYMQCMSRQQLGLSPQKIYWERKAGREGDNSFFLSVDHLSVSSQTTFNLLSNHFPRMQLRTATYQLMGTVYDSEGLELHAKQFWSAQDKIHSAIFWLRRKSKVYQLIQLYIPAPSFIPRWVQQLIALLMLLNYSCWSWS